MPQTGSQPSGAQKAADGGEENKADTSSKKKRKTKEPIPGTQKSVNKRGTEKAANPPIGTLKQEQATPAIQQTRQRKGTNIASITGDEGVTGSAKGEILDGGAAIPAKSVQAAPTLPLTNVSSTAEETKNSGVPTQQSHLSGMGAAAVAVGGVAIAAAAGGAAISKMTGTPPAGGALTGGLVGAAVGLISISLCSYCGLYPKIRDRPSP